MCRADWAYTSRDAVKDHGTTMSEPQGTWADFLWVAGTHLRVSFFAAPVLFIT